MESTFSPDKLYPLMSDAEFERQFPEVKQEILDYLQAGFVPGIFLSMTAANPGLAYTTWVAVREILCKGKVDRLVKEMILSAVSHSRDCAYCETAHFAIACRMGLPKEVMKMVLDNLEAVEPASTKAMIQFGIDLTHNNKLISPAYYEKLEASGVPKEHFSELLAMIGLSNLLVSYADALMVQPDTGFLELIDKAA